MKIQLNTDKNIQGTERLEAMVNDKINHELKHFSEHITRVEVHLSDENSLKTGPDDIQCKIETRVQSMQPFTVASKSDSKEKALALALDKMKAALRTAMGKLKDK